MRHSSRLRKSAVWLTTLVVMATLWLSAPAAWAGSATAWTITDMSGRVNIVRTGAAPVSLTNGDQLRPGDMIETAADSTAILVRNGESIVIAPNSRMGLPSTNDSGFATLILQQFGTLLLKVEKQQQQHFEVKTPYLAAVVKGTTFTVSVDTAGASVHVVEGLVQVANKTGMSAFVRPGQTALVSSAPGADLSVKGAATNNPTRQSQATQEQDDAAPGKSAAEPAAANVPATEVLPAAAIASPATFVIEDAVGTLDIDIATTTNGLIQAAQAPGQVGKAAGQDSGPKGASSLIAATGTTVGNTGSTVDGSLISTPGNAGTAPGISGVAPGISGSGPVAAGQTGILPATASLVAQIVASPGSQGNNGTGNSQ